MTRLPDFLIIGAQKAGTTSLHVSLRKHPDVWLPRMKEVHFFDWAYTNGIDWYLEHFEDAGDETVVGETSPFYLFHPAVPERVAAVLPDAKLIAVLRDPVDRAVSHYQYQVKYGGERRPMAEAFAADEDRIEVEEDITAYDEFGHAINSRSYLGRGCYARQLERWFKCFPREQSLVIESTTISRASRDGFYTVLDFLGVARVEPATKEYNTVEYEPVDAGVREHLARLYEPYNRELFDLLGTEFAWSRPS
jgi:hypothetical protein